MLGRGKSPGVELFVEGIYIVNYSDRLETYISSRFVLLELLASRIIVLQALGRLEEVMPA